jgi:hypothetical protein
MKNVVPQKVEAVSLIPGGKVWIPVDVCMYKYFWLVLDIRKSHFG